MTSWQEIRGKSPLIRSAAASAAASSAPGRVLYPGLAGGDEGHHLTQLLPDLLDLVGLTFLAERLELGPSGLGLGDPLLGEGPALDLIEDGLHLGAHGLVDDPGATGHIAVLGR